MWNIQRTQYGFQITFGGFIKPEEMREWVAASRRELSAPLAAGWGVVVDMRTLKPLPDDVQAIMVEGQKQYKLKGMTRSCVVLANSVTTMQFRRLAKDSGIDAWERYIDANACPDWQTPAARWVADGIEP